MTSLRMGVVGTGALGRHHARILAEMADVELTAVADVNAVVGAEVAQRCHTEWVADYRDLVGRVDGVVVAVPTQGHFAVAGEFLRNGIDVLVEKPIAASLEQAEHLVEWAAANGAILQVGHIERFNPAFVAARNYLDAPRYIRAQRYSPYSFRSTDIGVVHDMMIHDIDLVCSLVSAPVERVEAFGIAILGGHEDCVQARVTFADGCIADLSANRVSPITRRDMQVWSAGGCAHLDFAARETVVYLPSPMLHYGMPLVERAREPGADLDQLKSDVFGKYIKSHRPAVTPRDQLTEELLAFAESIRTRRRPLVGGVEATLAMSIAARIIERVAASGKSSAAERPLRKRAG
ncbi:MAG: Gfo/Idh/MocA family oxidoreductase [Planctomycetaceae bacterium]|nr:Gfo/Idh/MocA family oxidoreductase [Planctomycetaceae bacterium]